MTSTSYTSCWRHPFSPVPWRGPAAGLHRSIGSPVDTDTTKEEVSAGCWSAHHSGRRVVERWARRRPGCPASGACAQTTMRGRLAAAVTVPSNCFRINDPPPSEAGRLDGSSTGGEVGTAAAPLAKNDPVRPLERHGQGRRGPATARADLFSPSPGLPSGVAVCTMGGAGGGRGGAAATGGGGTPAGAPRHARQAGKTPRGGDVAPLRKGAHSVVACGARSPL